MYCSTHFQVCKATPLGSWFLLRFTFIWKFYWDLHYWFGAEGRKVESQAVLGPERLPQTSFQHNFLPAFFKLLPPKPPNHMLLANTDLERQFFSFPMDHCIFSFPVDHCNTRNKLTRWTMKADSPGRDGAYQDVGVGMEPISAQLNTSDRAGFPLWEASLSPAS